MKFNFALAKILFFLKAFRNLRSNIFAIELLIKAHFHYDQNHTRLVHFKELKKYFAILEHSNLARFASQSRDAFTDILLFKVS
jgi:hypothetical protein